MSSPPSAAARAFEEDFKQLCVQHNARAVFVLLDGADPIKGHRILTAGDERLNQMVDSALRAYHEVRPS